MEASIGIKIHENNVKAEAASLRDSAFLYEAAFVSAQDVNPFSLNSTFNPISAPVAVSS